MNTIVDLDRREVPSMTALDCTLPNSESAVDEDVIHSLNREFKAVRVGDKIWCASFNPQTLALSTLHPFSSFWLRLANRPHVQVGGKSIDQARYFRDHPERADAEIVFEPFRETRPGTLNLWIGFKIEPKQGPHDLISSHILNIICRGNSARRDRFEDLLTWAFTNPDHDKRLPISLVLLGSNGEARALLERLLCKFFHHDNYVRRYGASVSHCIPQNLANQALILLDECSNGGDKNGKRRQKLHRRIAAPSSSIRDRFVPDITVANHALVLISGGLDWIVPASEDPKRYFVITMNGVKYGDDLWEALWEEIDTCAAHYLYHILSRQLVHSLDELRHSMELED